MPEHIESQRTTGRQARRAWSKVVATGRDLYERERHLPRCLPVGPDEIADRSIAGRRRILARLAQALRSERSRGRGSHWTYDLNRHIALALAYAAERRDLDLIARSGAK
jgi:hypothetical protein